MKLESDGFSNSEPEFDGVWEDAIMNVIELGYFVTKKISVQDGLPYFNCEVTKVIKNERT